ncbi:MAG: histidine kinase [Ferruginibacter sp.]
MLQRNTISILLLGFCCTMCSSLLYAQPKYTPGDSAEVYRLLGRADDADLNGKMDSAIAITHLALEKSRQKNFLRGQAFAWLKLADLKLKKDGTANLTGYYDKAIQLATGLNDHFLNGLVLLQQAQQKSQSGEYEPAEKYCHGALKHFLLTDSIDYQAQTYNELGFIVEKSGKYEAATGYNLKAIPLFEKTGNIKEAANTSGNQAVVYYKLGRKEEALRMFKASAAAREGIHDVKGLAATYGNIATVYMPINEDSARKYYALQLYNAQKSGVKANIAQAYVNNMAVLSRQKKFRESLEYEHKAIMLFDEMGDKNKLGIRYASAGTLYHLVDDSLNAEKHFDMAEEMGNALNSKPILQNLYLQKTGFYKARNDFAKAYESNNKYYLYRDSLVNEKTATNIAALQTKYDTEKKDNEIIRLQTAERIQQLELERQQALLKGNQLEAQQKEQEIILLTQEQKLKDEDLRLKEELLTRQALLVKNNEQQLKIAAQEQALKEQELQKEKLVKQLIIAGLILAAIIAFILFSRYRLKRKLQEQQKILSIRDHISKDLHDEIGSTLTSINILSNISQKAFAQDPAQAKEMLQQISDQTKTIQQNMSDIVWALRPENESIENLEVRMREFAVQTLEANNIKTQFNFDDELLNQSLPHEIRKDLLLIYKEAVNNIVKHAGAGRVEITFRREMNKARLIIQDNGVGIKGIGNTVSGTGTKTMEQRASAIGGQLFIERKDGGTRVLLELPLP